MKKIISIFTLTLIWMMSWGQTLKLMNYYLLEPDGLILWHHEYIYDDNYNLLRIDQKIANRNQFDLISPNLIDSFENNFNELRKKYPEDINNITDVRERLYIDIINKIQANCGIIDIVDLRGVNI